MIEVETVRELLKGTRPGPWVSPWELPDTAEDAELNRFITADGECVVGFPMEYHPDALWCTRENARLIAAAPDIAALALAQAAEITRMREALEGALVRDKDRDGRWYECTDCGEMTPMNPSKIRHLPSCPLAIR